MPFFLNSLFHSDVVVASLHSSAAFFNASLVLVGHVLWSRLLISHLPKEQSKHKKSFELWEAQPMIFCAATISVMITASIECSVLPCLDDSVRSNFVPCLQDRFNISTSGAMKCSRSEERRVGKECA